MTAAARIILVGTGDFVDQRGFGNDTMFAGAASTATVKGGPRQRTFVSGRGAANASADSGGAMRPGTSADTGFCTNDHLALSGFSNIAAYGCANETVVLADNTTINIFGIGTNNVAVLSLCPGREDPSHHRGHRQCRERECTALARNPGVDALFLKRGQCPHIELHE